MTEAEMDDLVRLLASNPETGVLIVGSGGCRKVRLARTGGGKSGGYRVVTFFAPGDARLCIRCAGEGLARDLHRRRGQGHGGGQSADSEGAEVEGGRMIGLRDRGIG
jgi:hypothetical protein